MRVLQCERLQLGDDGALQQVAIGFAVTRSQQHRDRLVPRRGCEKMSAAAAPILAQWLRAARLPDGAVDTDSALTSFRWKSGTSSRSVDDPGRSLRGENEERQTRVRGTCAIWMVVLGVEQSLRHNVEISPS